MIEQDIQTILQRLDNIERLLLKLEKAAAPPKPPSKWMTVNGAAKQLGLRNGYQIRNLITKKVIGVADLGGKGIYVDTESLYQQANARLHRQGQRHPVTAYRLICTGTVDEMANAAIERKSGAQQGVIDALKTLIKQYC